MYVYGPLDDSIALPDFLEPSLIMYDFDVILPTLCRDTLQKAIDSVFGQTYPRWHLYVVSDGVYYPRDIDTRGDSRVTLLYLPDKNEDSGATPRNVGIDFGSSPLIAYIDDDDVWDEDHLKTHASYYDGHITQVKTAGKMFRKKKRVRRSSKKDSIISANFDDIMTVGISHTREMFEATNGWCCEDLNSHDRKLWYDMIRAGGNPAVVDAVTFRYLR